MAKWLMEYLYQVVAYTGSTMEAYAQSKEAQHISLPSIPTHRQPLSAPSMILT